MKRPDDEETLTKDIIRLATKYGRYGYKRITALLRVEGWRVNHKRVERIWRQEALKVPQKHKKRGRLYLSDGSIIRLRPSWKDHVWAYDFVAERLACGTKIRFLTVVDEYTRECLAIDVAGDGLEALDKARAARYDLILMDLQMPRLDGIEATRAIRALPGHGATPIIALTANAYSEDRRNAIAAGMNDFVAKPVSPEQLYAVLARWLPGAKA